MYAYDIRMYSTNRDHKSMPAIPIPRQEIQPRSQVIKLLINNTFIIQLYEIYLINENRQSAHAKGDLKEKKNRRTGPSLGV